MYTVTAYLVYILAILISNFNDFTQEGTVVSWQRVAVVFIALPLPFVIVFGLIEYWA